MLISAELKRCVYVCVRVCVCVCVGGGYVFTCFLDLL